MITLTEKYSIETDGAGCTLLFQESRERKKKDSEDKEQYTFKDEWYFLSVPQALNKFTDISLEECSDVKEMMVKLDEVKAIINRLK